MTNSAKRNAYTQGLREIADFLDDHAEVPLPYLDNTMTGSYEPALPIYLVGRDRKADLAVIARAMGSAIKFIDDDRFRLYRRFAGIALVAQVDRAEVCERVVTGVREVEVEVPDPEALAAVPTIKQITTVEDVVWECRPILADTDRSSDSPEAVSA